MNSEALSSAGVVHAILKPSCLGQGSTARKRTDGAENFPFIVELRTHSL
jgi:hypothetical protein